VVVDNLYFFGARVRPHKADPVLIVDADAVLAFPVAFECFQAVAGDRRKSLSDVAASRALRRFRAARSMAWRFFENSLLKSFSASASRKERITVLSV
jgi:hypothetical protein